MTLLEGARTGAPTITWTALQSGLWVGHIDGEFAGMIEAHWGLGFSATTRLAHDLGMFTTLEEAQAAFTRN
ncbi:MAG TPA: hypothetical protein VN200_07955 [Rhodoglobus sp.]|nr:hypothetical protein [Rhodoglobus sp.]